MILQAVWEFFQSQVFACPSRPGLFNVYRDEDERFDCPDAARLRRENLSAYLESFPGRPRWLLVGEAPGWKGCRFSGIPFTSEAQLAGHSANSQVGAASLPFHGHPTGRSGVFQREASASVFWETLRRHHPNFLVWNCLPLHPYNPGQPLSNRTPTPVEIQAFAPLLVGLAAALQPAQVIAIGRKAELALRQAGLAATCVRHPGHGGKRQFQREIEAVLTLPG